MKTEIKDLKIYAAYVKAQNDKISIDTVAKQFKCSRQAIYDALKRVKSGNHKLILRDLAAARNEVLWKHKYCARWFTVPPHKKIGSVNETTDIVKAMYMDGFPVTLIAKKLMMARTTIQFHLKK